MDNKFATIKGRVSQFLLIQGIKKEVFYKKIGMTSSNFRGSAQKTPLNSDAIANILSELPQMNSRCLLTGEGEMLRTLSPKTENSEADLSWYRQQIDARTEEVKELKQEIKELKAENRELRLENRELAQKLEEAREGLAIAEAAAKDIGALAQIS